MKPTSVGYNFNSLQEIRSHSAVLYNERMAILFYMLDMDSIALNSTYSPATIQKVRAIIKQIYKNIRMLLRQNPAARTILNLETSHDGIYTTDVQMGMIDKMIEHCELNGYNLKYMHIIVNELNSFEMVLKDSLQFFSYFIRPEFRQKPDIEIATERYKEIADKKTIDDLRSIIGRRHQIDFDNLGTKRVELTSTYNEDEEPGQLYDNSSADGSIKPPSDYSAAENSEEYESNESEDEKWKNQ